MSSFPIPPGSVLVTNTMILEASKLLQNDNQEIHYKKFYRIAKFFDFCSLVEASILNKYLVTLEGELPRDTSSLFLRNRLIKEGILIEKVVSFDYHEVRIILDNVVGQLEQFSITNDDKKRKKENLYSKYSYFKDLKNNEILKLGFLNPKRSPFYYDIEILKNELKRSSNIFEFYRNKKVKEHFSKSMGYFTDTYLLRVFFYYNASTRNCLSFFPDFPRVPFFNSIATYIHDSIIFSAYKPFAKKLECEALDFLNDASPISLPIPPFTSILLNRCNSVKDISSELLKLRDEYSELRENLFELEQNRRSCINIDERNKLKKKIENIFNATADKFSNNKKYLKLHYLAELAKPIFNPANPSSYTKSLLKMPIDWIKNWWNRRPLVQFFDCAKEFRNIPQYNKLIKKIFGIEFNLNEIESFKKHQNILNNLFNKKN